MLQKGFFKDVSREKINKIMEDEGFTPKLITDKPNFIYKHPEIKYLACLEGSMKVTVKEKIHDFAPGDKLLIPGNTLHSAVISNEGCVFFWSKKMQN